MVIWKSTPTIVKNKMTHVRKIGGRLYRSFILNYGDIPIAQYNEVTNKWEEVVNHRSNAYAARKRQRYQRRNHE
jgi:hypothetical protein